MNNQWFFFTFHIVILTYLTEPLLNSMNGHIVWKIPLTIVKLKPGCFFNEFNINYLAVIIIIFISNNIVNNKGIMVYKTVHKNF